MSSSKTPSKGLKNQQHQRQDPHSSFLQEIADLSPDLLFVIDLNKLEIIYVNNRIEQLLGCDASYVYNKGAEIFKTLLHPHDYERRMANLEACRKLSGEDETAVEVRLKVVNDGWNWFRIRDKVFKRDPNGAVSLTIGNAQNIHAQKMADKKLKEERRRFKDAQAIGHIGSFERKLPGDLLICSEEFLRIHGLDLQPDTISVQQFLSYIHPDDLEAFMQAVYHTHATGEPLNLVNRIVRPDGLIRHVHRRSEIIKNSHGAPIRVWGTIQDVTEQVAAQQKLQQSENLLRLAEAAGSFGSYQFHINSMHLEVSEGFSRLFGYEPGGFEASLAFVDKVTHPDDIPKIQQALEQASQDKQPYEYHRRIYLPNGQMRHLNSKGKVVCDAAGNALKFIGIVKDVTEQKKAEDTFLKTEESLTIALEASQMGTWDLDLSKDFSGRRSLRHDQIFGYKEVQAQWGQKIAKRHIVEEDQGIFDAAFARARQTGKLNFEVRVRWPDRSIHWMAVEGHFYFDEKGRPVRAAGVNFDITERKHAEKQLEESAYFISKVADTTPDILFVFDLERMRLHYINRDLTPLLGKTFQELQAMDPELLFSLAHPQEREAAYAYIRSFEEASDDEMKEVEFRLQNLKGEWLWYHCRGRVFKRNNEGKVVQVLSIMRDITTEKKTQKALLEAEKLSTKGTMARTIAHEVRGPVANISLSMGILQQELGAALKENEGAKVYFDIVSKSCSRITNYINELISISITEPDSFVKNDLAILIREVLQQAQDRIFLKGIQVERNFGKGYFINADRERLKIAILNIIMNAVEAMEDQEGILQVSIRQHGNQVQLTIQDNGCGMTAEQQSKMFDVYYTSKLSGMGVGLANVQAILQSHAARIEVKSQPGRGTAFTVNFDKVN